MKIREVSVYLIFVIWQIFMVPIYAEQSAHPPIIYDWQNDRLTVSLENVSLTQTLGYIANISGLEVLMDPKAEKQISADFKNLPMEKALQRLLGETSHIFLYDSQPTETLDLKSTSKIIVGVHILSTGENNNDILLPILAAKGEAFIREGYRYNSHMPAPEIFNFTQQRWEARLKSMDEERREALLDQARLKYENIAKRLKEKQLRTEKITQKMEARKLSREHELSQLKLDDPEAYARTIQAREEILKKIAQ